MNKAQQYAVNEAINELCRAAFRLAPKVYDSAMDSGCTDTRPEAGARRQRAWDLVKVAYRLNELSESASHKTALHTLAEWTEIGQVGGSPIVPTPGVREMLVRPIYRYPAETPTGWALIEIHEAGEVYRVSSFDTYDDAANERYYLRANGVRA